MRCTSADIRYLNKNKNRNTKNVVNHWVNEITNLYGTRVSYFKNRYSLDGHDHLYGEHPTAGYETPVSMTVLAEFGQDPLFLSKFGWNNDSQLTIFIPFEMFGNAYGDPASEPKAGDLIRLDEYGMDRPGGGGYPYNYPNMTSVSGTTPEERLCIENGLPLLTGEIEYPPASADWLRGANIFEITERRDENITGNLNPLLFHTTWQLKCKRFDYSYEPDAPQEFGSDQVGDSTFFGKLTGGTETPEKAKKYTQNANDESDTYWNYASGGLDGVYGGYGPGVQ